MPFSGRDLLGIAWFHAVVVKRHLDGATLGRLQREAEERLGVLGIEVTAAETVDAAQAQGVVLRVVLES